jgi:S-adenosylmethionine/arginine decarboxylase-like enzyme
VATGQPHPLPLAHDIVSDAVHVVHVSAELTGVGSGALRDAALLSGLLIAAAGAAGLNAPGSPVVRVAPAGGVSALLPLDPGHASVHTFPSRGLALVDILALDDTGAAKALEVFVRRLVPADVKSETRSRG